MASTGFYNPTVKAPTYKLPSMQSGANNLTAINPYGYQTAKNTTGYSGGYQPNTNTYGMTGPVVGSQNPGQPGGISAFQKQTASTIPNIQAAAPHTPDVPADTSAEDQAYMYKLMNDDPTLSAELDALAAQNQSQWGSYLTQAQQAEIAYGGGYDQNAAGLLGYNPSVFAPGTLQNTIPNNTHALGTPSGSLVSALSDPAILAAIAPGTGGYNVSAMGQIANQFQTNNRTVDANLRARGIYGSSALGQHLNENLQTNQLAQNSALTNFLNALQGGYGTYLSGFGGLQGQQAGDVQTALNNVISGIQGGVYTLPSAARANALKLQQQQQQQQQQSAPGIDWGPPDITPGSSASDLWSGVSTPNAQGIYPATNALPEWASVTANRTGGSANKTQGVFAIH